MFRLGKLSAAVISANAAIATSLAAGSAFAASQEIEEVIVTAIPLYHRLKVYTAYEYLETRLDVKT